MCLEIKGILWEIDVHCSQKLVTSGKGSVVQFGAVKKVKMMTDGNVVRLGEMCSVKGRLAACLPKWRCAQSVKGAHNTSLYFLHFVILLFPLHFQGPTMTCRFETHWCQRCDQGWAKRRQLSWEARRPYISPFFETIVIFLLEFAKVFFTKNEVELRGPPPIYLTLFQDNSRFWRRLFIPLEFAKVFLSCKKKAVEWAIYPDYNISGFLPFNLSSRLFSFFAESPSSMFCQ